MEICPMEMSPFELSTLILTNPNHSQEERRRVGGKYDKISLLIFLISKIVMRKTLTIIIIIIIYFEFFLMS